MLRERALSPTPDSSNNAATGTRREARITSRRARSCLLLFALHVFDADGALALEQDLRGVRLGLDAQIGAAADMRMHIGARRAPALAVLLRHLVGAEPFMVLGIEILANAELRLLRGLQEDLMHRIVRCAAC